MEKSIYEIGVKFELGIDFSRLKKENTTEVVYDIFMNVQLHVVIYVIF